MFICSHDDLNEITIDEVKFSNNQPLIESRNAEIESFKNRISEINDDVLTKFVKDFDHCLMTLFNLVFIRGEQKNNRRKLVLTNWLLILSFILLIIVAVISSFGNFLYVVFLAIWTYLLSKLITINVYENHLRTRHEIEIKDAAEHNFDMYLVHEIFKCDEILEKRCKQFDDEEFERNRLLIDIAIIDFKHSRLNHY